MAGEIEIMSTSDLDAGELAGRTDLLRDILYNAGFYKWSAVKHFNAAVLSEIEMGIRQWGGLHFEIRTTNSDAISLQETRVKKGESCEFVFCREEIMVLCRISDE